MSEAFIVRRGGGVGKLFAAIGVTYPEGSTCTCTKDNKTLKAGDTSGRWVFPVSETGTYTISCTKGSETATKTVSITAQGQVASVTLAYWNGELYNAGNEYTTITGGWAKYPNSITNAPTVTKEAARMVINNNADGEGWGYGTTNTINTRGYSKLHYKGEYVSGYWSMIKLCITANRTGKRSDAEIAAQVTIDDPTVEHTISDIPQGDYYIGFFDNFTSGATIGVTKVWLT